MTDRERIEEECESAYMNGCASEVSGDVEAPTGHFYRVDNHIVTTDERGFKKLVTYVTVEEAQKEFAELSDEYAEWAGDE